MNCERTGGLIMKYFDGEMSVSETDQMNEHLKQCESCSQEFEALKGIFDPVYNNVTIEPPENFEASVMRRIASYELLKKKKRDMLVAILYSSFTIGIVTLVLVISYVTSNVDINSFVRHLGAFSGTVENIIGFAVKYYVFLSGIVGGLLKVFIALAKTYYSLFVLMTGALIMSYSMIKSQPKHKEEGAG